MQKNNHKNSTALGNFKNLKVSTQRIFKNKTLGYGVGTILPNTTKYVFRQDLINQDLEMDRTELEINAKRVLIGNIYIPSKMIEQIHVLDRFLDNQEDKAIIILKDFNTQNTLWNKDINQDNKMGISVEKLIQIQDLYVTTDLDHCTKNEVFH